IIQRDQETTPPKRIDIQWPALDNLSPNALKGNLQRTMSTLMKEWEKTLQSPTEELVGEIPSGSNAETNTPEEVAMMSI
ncbi:unnamed protein product, partial [Diplocarpon coronariae]